MSVRIIPKEQQGYGAFNGGEIVENKPIGFPQDHSTVRPYSNLFYWAHARAMTDSTIGLHPHQGFEICSFVLNGEIRHYDTKLKEWRPLKAGDVQIIRAGNGISHSEFIAKDGEIFQIWFDPDLTKTLDKPATYDDYKAADFPVKTENGVTVKTLAGPGSPFRMDTPGVEVFQIEIENGTYTLPADSTKIYSAYVLEGEVLFNGEDAKPSDFVQITEQSKIELQSLAGAKVFIIASPLTPGYRTYGQLRRVG
ncbi:MAG TPA: pirin family protein [Saprospiraceae bacterium]|nr:pirin family protein [Saprospiraceae bacterium]